MNGRLKNWLRGGRPYFLLDVALLSALALTLAHWTWTFFAPAPIAAPAVHAGDEMELSGYEAARQLFGAAQGALAPAIAPAAKLRLVGIAAPSAQEEGRAIFALENGKSRIALAGDDVFPGLVLREVHPDHVLIERDGLTERIGLERRAAGVDLAPRARRDGGR